MFDDSFAPSDQYEGSAVRPVINLGAMYKGKRLSFGASIMDVNDKDLQIVADGNPDQVWTKSVYRTIYLTGSYLFDLGEKFQLEPQLLYYNSAGFQSLNVNLVATYDKRFWLGAGSQFRDGYSLMGGMDFYNFRLGYACRATVSRLANGVGSFGHELVLRYALLYNN